MGFARIGNGLRADARTVKLTLLTLGQTERTTGMREAKRNLVAEVRDHEGQDAVWAMMLFRSHL